ncbi:MAG: acyl-CoA thioesterase [Cyanobacteria bacterium P01_F01_bin.42]
MVFVYERSIHFIETDAAGIMNFAHGLAICHEAYEASLGHAGIEVAKFFSARAIAVPITYASIDYNRPSYCGDRIQVHLRPAFVSDTEFKISYQLYGSDGVLRSQAQTRQLRIALAMIARLETAAFACDWLP